jgi:hypothetical protein
MVSFWPAFQLTLVKFIARDAISAGGVEIVGQVGIQVRQGDEREQLDRHRVHQVLRNLLACEGVLPVLSGLPVNGS